MTVLTEQGSPRCANENMLGHLAKMEFPEYVDNKEVPFRSRIFSNLFLGSSAFKQGEKVCYKQHQLW